MTFVSASKESEDELRLGTSERESTPAALERLLLYALFLAVPVLTGKPFGSGVTFKWIDVLLFPLTAMWIGRRLLTAEPLFPRTVFRNQLWLLLMSALVATAFASNAKASLLGLAIMLTRFYVLFAISADLLREPSHQKTAITALAIGVAPSALIGIAQGTFGSAYVFGDLELNSNVTASVGGSRVLRTIGTFANALNFANYLSVTIFACLIALWSKRRTSKLFGAFSLAVGVVALFQTLSRGPVLAVVAGSIGIWLTGEGRRNVGKALAGATAVLVFSIFPVFGTSIAQAVLGGGLVARFAQVVERYDTDVRFGLWTEALRAAPRHVFGVGLKNSGYRVRWTPHAKAIPHYMPYSTGSWRPFNFHFENVYIATYMNLGVLGLAGFVWLLFSMLAVPWKYLHASHEETGRMVARVLFACTLTFALNMVTNPAILSDQRIMALFWLLLGLSASLGRQPSLARPVSP